MACVADPDNINYNYVLLSRSRAVVYIGNEPCETAEKTIP